LPQNSYELLLPFSLGLVLLKLAQTPFQDLG
jgi:hypothetical protein